MSYKEIMCKELIKNGYSLENGVRVWSIARRAFRYMDSDMAKVYLKLREHPRYKAVIIDIEIELLKKYASGFLSLFKDEKFNLIDLAASDGLKAKTIIRLLPKNIKFRYCPVNINDYLVKVALENVKKEGFANVIEYAPRLSDDCKNFDEVGAALRNSKYQKNVVLLLGSLLASFEINDYLFRLSNSMLPGDLLVIGNGIRKGPRFSNLETYKHPIFNEWLIHLMRQIGFSDKEVEYDARFANGRLEAFYKIKVDKVIYGERKIEFKKGDIIIVAFHYKLYDYELGDFCRQYFEKVELVKDPAEEYALVFCRK